MHPYTSPGWVKDRVMRRQGKLASHETIDAGRTALVVVDMQNYFCTEGFPLEIPAARGIVPNINKLAHALRAAGGTVIWLQTSSAAALKDWSHLHTYMLTPEKSKARLDHLDESAEGFALYPRLEPLPTDLRVKKTTYSAFTPDPTAMHAALRRRGVESVLITGTATNVCCESTARDAMLHDYRVVMVADGNATNTDEEHASSLNNFHLFFGDVLTTDDVIARLMPAQARRTA
jgi:ureidoacrylate peracid hydrolase